MSIHWDKIVIILSFVVIIGKYFLNNSLETMFISQISSRFDELLDENLQFKDSWIYKKIQRLLYVPVVKIDKNPDNWYFLKTVFIDISHNKELYIQLKEDFMKKINPV